MSDKTNSLKRLLDKLPYLVIGIGVLLRICVYVQNRTLEVDETNVARNIYELGYAELLRPLHYQQFAPFGFLWCLKFFTGLLGYGEMAFRFFPLICAIASLICLYRLLKHFGTGTAVLYPLFLFATGYIYLYYATEIKQYATETLVTVVLLLLTLKTDIHTTKGPRFILTWLIAGIAGMFFSLPSVFILAGVGAYYFVTVLKHKNYSKLYMLLGVYAIWVSFFLAEYVFILKASIHSDFLQWYHGQYFPELLPKSAEDWKKNLEIFIQLTYKMGGDTTLAIIFNLLLLFVGAIILLRRNLARAVLLLVPFLAVILTSGFHQFTLIPRVMLFITPFAFGLMTETLNQLLNIKYKLVIGGVSIVAIICGKNFGEVQYFCKPLLFEEFRDALTVVQHKGFSSKKVHVNCLLEPALIYYTHIHPDKKKWINMADADIMQWTTNYDSLAQTFTHDVVIYAWYPDDFYNKEIALYSKYCNLEAIDVYGMRISVCTKKD